MTKMNLNEKINSVLDTDMVPEEDKTLLAMQMQMHPEMLEMFD